MIQYLIKINARGYRTGHVRALAKRFQAERFQNGHVSLRCYAKDLFALLRPLLRRPSQRLDPLPGVSQGARDG